MYKAPCAKLITPSTPNTKVKPDATKNNNIPIFSPPAVCEIKQAGVIMQSKRAKISMI
jgi:hypothetical protein